MNPFENILMQAEQPSRYLGTEVNSVRKDPDKVKLRVALAFPDLYDIGMSHFGIQILYAVLNRRPDVAAERAFAPGADVERLLRSMDLPLASLESRTPLNAFDIIGFSLQYELNYTNILLMLDLARIPFRAAERDASFPLIIAGGPCVCNPEPVAAFFDAMVFGDGEEAVLQITDVFLDWKAGGGRDKQTLLSALAGVAGVYVPSFFEPVYAEDGAASLTPLKNNYHKVTRAVVDDLDAALFPTSPVVAFGKPVHDRLRIEVARGCTRGCRFCQAGFLYRPVRERSLETLLHLTAASLSSTGYEELSLLSLSTGDYSCIQPLMQQLNQRYASDHIAVSLPSIRAETLSPELMTRIRKIRKTGFTIAPEAGSDRLRRIINKNLEETDIMQTVAAAFDLGWNLIKLYFMVGLPGETPRDLDELVGLVKRLRKCLPAKNRKSAINVSIGAFIPKPHTPFQRTAQIPLEQSRAVIEDLRRRLDLPGIQVKWQRPEVSQLEGAFARGDRRLSEVLTAAYRRGCRFDGWSDRFDFEKWQAAFSDVGVDMAEFTLRERRADAPLPWDHMDTRVSRAFFESEYEKAMTEASTPDCRFDACGGCGVCDFDRIMPRIHAPDHARAEEAPLPKKQDPSAYAGARIGFSKTGPARFFGHLEMVNIFLRAIHRAGLKIKFSEGFHPMPKIAFSDTLPVGMESMDEHFTVFFDAQTPLAQVPKALNRQLPEGLMIKDCRVSGAKPKSGGRRKETYLITRAEGTFKKALFKKFTDAPRWLLKKTTKKGAEKTIDLKSVVADVQMTRPDQLKLTLRNSPDATVRPHAVLGEVFGLSDDAVRRASIIKLFQDAG